MGSAGAQLLLQHFWFALKNTEMKLLFSSQHLCQNDFSESREYRSTSGTFQDAADSFQEAAELLNPLGRVGSTRRCWALFLVLLLLTPGLREGHGGDLGDGQK